VPAPVNVGQIRVSPVVGWKTGSNPIFQLQTFHGVVFSIMIHTANKIIYNSTHRRHKHRSTLTNIWSGLLINLADLNLQIIKVIFYK